jgi:ABC-type Fe3+ transport system substrate-binding protein
MSALPVQSTAITPDDVAALTGLSRPKWQKFVAAYCSGQTQTIAVQSAGYTTSVPKQAATQLLKTPAVAEAVKAVRAEMARRAEYGMDRLIADLDEAAEFAKTTENATALVRARELKGKALGLLMDRVDMRVMQIPFRIEINTLLPVLELKP